MKTAFSLVALIFCTAMSASSAFASAELPTPEHDMDRFDVSCNFGSTGCEAAARIFGEFDDSSSSPRWGGDLLAVACRGQLLYANDAQLVRVNHHWVIEGVNGSPTITLGDDPFSGSPNPKTVAAILHFQNDGSAPGHCEIHRTGH